MNDAPVIPRDPPGWQGPAGEVALAAWCDAEVADPGQGPLRLTLMQGGSSASVLLTERGNRRMVIRTTSWPPRPDSARSLAREARLLGALGRTEVPHPALLGYCADDHVIGAPFLVMEHVDGWLGAAHPPPAFVADPALLHATAFALIDGLAALALVDPVAIGLGDFGRPEAFLERQVDRWAGLMAQHRAHPAYGDRTLAGFDEVGAWLRDKMPGMQRVSLIHGDASYSNVMFGNDSPARLAAIIDWEIATLGDPLLDLGRALYPFPSRDGTPGYSLAIDHAGYPARETLAAHYAERTGLSVAALDYYLVLSMYKLAALIEFNHVKRLSEPAGSMAQRIADFIPGLIAGAHDIARRSQL
ncbi:MAG: phosphotransferase family protein [Bradyrhizobium sp.]|nr:phosphotransferase family protein [Bradyrhizobium sp.]